MIQRHLMTCPRSQKGGLDPTHILLSFHYTAYIPKVVWFKLSLFLNNVKS